MPSEMTNSSQVVDGKFYSTLQRRMTTGLQTVRTLDNQIIWYNLTEVFLIVKSLILMVSLSRTKFAVLLNQVNDTNKMLNKISMRFLILTIILSK